jgi:hypothetical protein
VNVPAHETLHRTCAVCRGPIKIGDGRYRVGETEYHPDCYRFWFITPLPSSDDALGLCRGSA